MKRTIKNALIIAGGIVLWHFGFLVVISGRAAAQDLQNGDLVVGYAATVDSFGNTTGGILRVRGTSTATFCQSAPNGPGFWNIPHQVVVDSQARVLLLTDTGQGGMGLLRCGSLGGTPEPLGFFATFPNITPPLGYPVPFPSTIFGPFAGLHLAKVRTMIIDDTMNGGLPQVTTEDVYTFAAEDVGSGLTQLYKFHTATGTWEKSSDLNTQFINPPVDLVNHAGNLYALASGDTLRRVFSPFELKASGSAGGLNFSLDLSLFGGMSEVKQLTLDDSTIPNVDSHCNLNDGISNLMPLNNDGLFKAMDGLQAIAYDEFDGLRLVMSSSSGAAGTPYLANTSETLLDNPSDRSQFFHDGFANCAAMPSLQFTSILPWNSSTGLPNDVDGGGHNMASTPSGVVGTQRFEGTVIGIAPGNQVQILVSGIASPSGIGGYPNGVQPPAGLVVVIRVNDGVNALVTDSNGKRIGVDSSGNVVNDYGLNGFDSGTTKPRIFAIKNPNATSFTVETSGTSSGSYSVDLYTTDLSQTSGHLLNLTGTTSKGKTNEQVLALDADQSLTSVLSIPNASLTFGTQLVGTASPARSLRVYNRATSALAVSAVVSNGDFNQSNNCAPKIKPLGSCSVVVAFAPTQRGMRTGTISLTDAASGVPQVISLAGTATVVSLSSSKINSGSQAVGTTSAPSTITVSNVDTSAPVNISGITLSGLDKNDFTVVNTCTPQIAPSGDCALTVTFTPKATGTRTATISINDDGGASPQKIGLIGTGL